MVGRRRQELDDVVKAGLRDAIATHGPVTEANLASASKRITGQIVNSAWAEMAEAAVVERLHKRLDQLRHGHARTVDENRRLRERIAELQPAVNIGDAGADDVTSGEVGR